MFGRRLLVFLFLFIAAAVTIIIQPSQGAHATFYRPGTVFRTCADTTSQAVSATKGIGQFACTNSVLPSTALDSITIFDIAPPDANFQAVVTYTPKFPDSASGFTLASDADIAVGPGGHGAVVGELHSVATLGLANGACLSRLEPTFTFVDATTDFLSGGPPAVDPAKLISPSGPPDNRLVNLGEDVAPANGVPDGADLYPSYLITLTDPDGPAGPKLPPVPRARYLGVDVVPPQPTGTVVILQFLVFEPGALRPIVGAGGSVASLGFGSFTVLQDPTEAPTNGAISDFCTPLAATTALDAKTRDNLCTRSGGDPAAPADCAFSVTAGGLGKFVNRVVEGPCPGTTTPNECGTTRFSSNGAGTAKYVVQTQAIRAVDDGDDWENNLDPCFKTNSSAWNPRIAGTTGDTDEDGLPNDCDPDNNPFSNDQDTDRWPNRLDNCPRVKNGDTFLSGLHAIGSGSLSVIDVRGFPANPAGVDAFDFEVAIDSGTNLERRTVTGVSPTPPAPAEEPVADTAGTFTLATNTSIQHSNNTAVAQVFKPNSNQGQADQDVLFPGVVPEGPRNDLIGPECDTGTAGTDTLTATAAQGHYHRTATVSRICIGNPPADSDGDNVCNGDEPGGCASAPDCDNDSAALGEAERIYKDNGNHTVGLGDTLLTGAPNQAAGTPSICPVGVDCGQALVDFLVNEKHTEDETVNGAYDANECIYRDVDSSGTVSNTDRRLRVDTAPDVALVPADGQLGPLDATPDCSFAPQSTVSGCPGPADCGRTLVAFAADEEHFDSRVPAAGLNSTAYRDVSQTCFNRLSDDSDFSIDLADSDCLGLHGDAQDNCISTANTAATGFTQVDVDWDSVGDACDGLIDADQDGNTDSVERYVGTGVDTVCSRDSTSGNEPIDGQPEDVTDDRSITAFDLNDIAGVIGANVSTNPALFRRKDIDPASDGSITAFDLNQVAGKIGQNCDALGV